MKKIKLLKHGTSKLMKENIIHGTIYLTVAQIAFAVFGYITHVGLARFLGPTEYGVYAVVISLVTTANLILSSGIPQALSKYVAHDDGSSELIKKTSVKVQLIFSIVIFTIYLILSENIALFLNDGSMTPFIRISALVIPGYSLYSILLAYMNGLREYKKQSVNSIFYSFFNTSIIFLLVLTGYSTIGAVIGFVIAPLVGASMGLYFTRNKKLETEDEQRRFLITDPKFLLKKIINFSIPIIIYSVALHLLMVVDLFFVKRYLTSYDVGIYSAVSMISRIPFLLSGGLYGALFPAISNVTANCGKKETQKYVINSLKVSIAVLIPLIFAIIVFSSKTIILLYSSEYIEGSQTLKILIFGFGFFSLFTLFTTILNGSGMPKIPLNISLIALALNIVLNYLTVPRYQLNGAAISTSFACFTAFVIAGIYVHEKFWSKTEK